MSCDNGTGLTIKIGDVELIVRKDPRSGGYNLNASASGYEIDSETTWAPDGFSYSCMALQLIQKPKSNDKVTVRSFPDILDDRKTLYGMSNICLFSSR